MSQAIRQGVYPAHGLIGAVRLLSLTTAFIDILKLNWDLQQELAAAPMQIGSNLGLEDAIAGARR